MMADVHLEHAIRTPYRQRPVSLIARLSGHLGLDVVALAKSLSILIAYKRRILLEAMEPARLFCLLLFDKFELELSRVDYGFQSLAIVFSMERTGLMRLM